MVAVNYKTSVIVPPLTQVDAYVLALQRSLDARTPDSYLGNRVEALGVAEIEIEVTATGSSLVDALHTAEIRVKEAVSAVNSAHHNNGDTPDVDRADLAGLNAPHGAVAQQVRAADS